MEKEGDVAGGVAFEVLEGEEVGPNDAGKAVGSGPPPPEGLASGKGEGEGELGAGDGKGLPFAGGCGREERGGEGPPGFGPEGCGLRIRVSDRVFLWWCRRRRRRRSRGRQRLPRFYPPPLGHGSGERGSGSEEGKRREQRL